jgi:hypothetical protein
MPRVRHEQVHRLITTINEAVYLAEGLGLKRIAASLQQLRQQTLNDVVARNRIDERGGEYIGVDPRKPKG